MPTVTDLDGVAKEMSQEEFQEKMSQGDAKIISVQQIITDKETGEVISKKELLQKDGSIDLFGGLFADNRCEEELIEDAEDGDEEAMQKLANLYLNGDAEVDQDPEKAVFWYTKLAELEDSDAQFNLGLHYAKGFGVPRDFAKALCWMERAQENGDTDAIGLIGPYREAAAAMEKAAAGDAQAQADLAAILTSLSASLEQAGREKDFAEAFELAQKSAAQDNGDGIWALALAYEHGRGVEQDVDKALEWYRKGMELGHAKSMHNLGCYYMRGNYLPQDKPRAIELCRKAAELGYDMAEFFMAKAYETGDGVEEDLEKAWEWGEKAAAHSTPEIQYQVAKLYTYDDDEGNMLNPERARYWLSKAAERGHEMAYNMLNFAPMWNKDEFEPDEDEEDPDAPAWLQPALRLAKVVMANGMPAGENGGLPDLNEMIGFARFLAENGDQDAAEALQDFLDAIDAGDDEEAEENENQDPLAAEAEAALETLQEQFVTWKWEWEKYPDEVYEKCKEILSRNAKDVSDVEKNRPAVEKYLDRVKQQLPERVEQFHKALRDFDAKLEYFRDAGLEEAAMGSLIEHFVQWVDYGEVITFELVGAKKEWKLPEEDLAKKWKWLGKEPEAPDAKPEPPKPEPPEASIEDVLEKRKAAAAELRNAFQVEYEKECAELTGKYSGEKEKLDREIAKLEQKLSEKEAQLSALGFFRFGEKKAVKAQITELQQSLERLEKEIKALDSQVEQQKNELKQSMRKKWEGQWQVIRDDVPVLKKLSLNDLVLLAMDPGVKYTVEEVLEQSHLPEEATAYIVRQRVLDPLVSQRKLRRTTKDGMTAYMLA